MSLLKAIVLPMWRLFPDDSRVRLRRVLAKIGSSLLVGLLTLLDPFVRLRFIMLIYTRIGHFALNTDLFLRKLTLNGRPPRTHYIFIGANTPDVANRELMALWKRHITVLDRGFLSAFLRFIWQSFEYTRFVRPLTDSNFLESQEYVVVDSVAQLTLDDERRGLARLRKMGIAEDDWFVCIYNRDARYLAKIYGEPTDYSYRSGDYQSHRDSEISSFLPAARLIAGQGGFALRMGAVVRERIDHLNEKGIIDYASLYRDEFMDIYIPAKCKFFLGDSAGLAQIALLFDRPIAYTNSIPLNNMNPGRSSLMIPKMFRRYGEQRFMTYGEIQQLGLFETKTRAGGHAAWYRERQIEVVANSADDILDLCQDMSDLLAGQAPPPGAAEAQRAYKDRFFGFDEDRAYAPNIGARFARKYQNLISG